MRVDIVLKDRIKRLSRAGVFFMAVKGQDGVFVGFVFGANRLQIKRKAEFLGVVPFGVLCKNKGYL